MNSLIMKECVSKAHLRIFPYKAEKNVSTADKSVDNIHAQQRVLWVLKYLEFWTLWHLCCLVIVSFSTPVAQMQKYTRKTHTKQK